MNYFSLISKGIQLKLKYGFVLFFFICCEMVFPFQGWTQSFQDTGSFSFTGSHNPLRRPILREFLPGDGLKVGPVQLHPFFGVAEVFTDNVFRTKKQRRNDFLTTIAPGIQAYLPFGGQHSFLLDYRAAQFLYGKFTENNVFTQHGVGQLRLKFPGGLKFDFQGGPVDGFDRRGSELDIQNRDITKWRATTFLGRASLRGSRGGIRLRSRYTRWHFKNNGQDVSRDRKNISGSLAGFVNATQAVSGVLGVNISNNTFDENRQLDSFSYGVFTGFEIAPSRLLSGEVTVGYTILNFDRAPIGDDNEVQNLRDKGLSPGGDQQKRLIIRGNLLWRPTTRQLVGIRAFRTIRQSAVFDTATFTQSGISLQGSQRVTNRFGLQEGFLYSNNKFAQGRTDNRFGLRLSLRYRTVEWLGFRLGYFFEKRFSSERQFKFYSNTISVSAQALF